MNLYDKVKAVALLRDISETCATYENGCRSDCPYFLKNDVCMFNRHWSAPDRWHDILNSDLMKVFDTGK